MSQEHQTAEGSEKQVSTQAVAGLGRAAPAVRINARGDHRPTSYRKPTRIDRLLNPKHEALVLAYMANGRNGTRAAIAAGYSPKTANVQASEILQKPDVKARIRALTEEAFQDAGMSAAEVLGRLAHVARFDVRKLYDAETGEAKQIKDLDEATAAAIVSFETELLIGKEGGNLWVATRKIKAADKIAALKILAEHHGLIGSDASQAAGALVDALADRMEAARQRSIAQAEADRMRTIEAEPRVITDDEDVPK